MSEFAFWLERQRAAPPEEGGLTVIDLLDAPPPVRSLLRLLLRRGALSRQELAEHAASQSVAQCLSPADLDAMLELLCRQGWLQRLDEAACPRYRLCLRHKTSAGRLGPIAEGS